MKIKRLGHLFNHSMKKDNNRKSKKLRISYVRAEFYKHLKFLLFGVIPILIVWEQEGPAKLIGFAGFLFSIYHLVIIIYMSQFIVDDFFPPKTVFESKSKLCDKIIYALVMILFFVTLIFLIFEIKIMENTINSMTMFWQSALIGIGIATLITVLLKYFFPSVYYESSRRFTVHSGLFLSLFFLTPASASYINYKQAEVRTKCAEYEIVEKSKGPKKKNSWLFIKLNATTIERFNVGRTFFDKVKEGEKIQMCTREGKFGYDVVVEFKTLNEW